MLPRLDLNIIVEALARAFDAATDFIGRVHCSCIVCSMLLKAHLMLMDVVVGGDGGDDPTLPAKNLRRI